MTAGLRSQQRVRPRSDGIAHLASRDYTRINGGQRQLALIARALAQEASIVVMDEPTASLDFGNQVLALEQVMRLAASGIGSVLSTHDPGHALACATSVHVLEEESTRAAGLPAEILSEALLNSIYGAKLQIEVLPSGYRVCVPRALFERSGSSMRSSG